MIRRYKIGYEVRAAQAHAGVRPALADRARRASGRRHRRRGSETAPLPRVEHAHRRAAHRRRARCALIATADAGLDVLCDARRRRGGRGGTAATPARPPVSEEAAEIVRVERGRPRYGVELDESTIPQEAGLNERAVSFTKGCYVGQETVARLYYRGKPNRHLRGLRLSEPARRRRAATRRAPRRLSSFAAATADDRPGARREASGRPSPRSSGRIALAFVRREARRRATIARASASRGASAEAHRAATVERRVERAAVRRSRARGQRVRSGGRAGRRGPRSCRCLRIAAC